MDGPRLTRRQAVRLGAGAAALGALRLPSPAFAATQPALFELALQSTAGAHAASAGWRTTKVLQAPRRFDLLGLVWDAGTPQAQVRARRAGGRWTRWTPLPHNHAGDHDRTDPVFTGSADEFQLRLRGGARGLQRALRARAPPRARARRARAAARQGSAPAIVPRAGWGGDSVPPRGGAELRRRAGGVRAPHGLGRRLRARGVGRDHPRASRATTATPTAGTTSVTTSSSTATA